MPGNQSRPTEDLELPMGGVDASSPAGRAEAERIQREREEAARRLAAARAQIAEFDKNDGRKRFGRARHSREDAEVLSSLTQQAEARAQQAAEPRRLRAVAEPRSDAPDGRQAGRDVLAAFADEARERQSAPAEPTGPPETGRRAARTGETERPRLRLTRPERPAVPETTSPPGAPWDAPGASRSAPAPAPAATPAPARASHPSAPSTAPVDSGRNARPTGFSTNVDFKPRTGTRRIMAVLLLILLAGSGYAAWAVVEVQNTLTIGIAVVLGAVTLLVWAIRVNTPVTHMKVRSGLLVIKTGGNRQVFDLNSRYTPMEVIGKPGRSSWRVVMLRSDGLPQVIDSTMVDPQHFMKVLVDHRPDLAS